MTRIILDAHEDIAYNALYFGRDYRAPVVETRQRERGRPWPLAMLGLPDALLGRVAIVFATLFAPSRSAARLLPPGSRTYNTPQEAYQLAMSQLDYYQRLADESDKIRLIRTQADLDAVLATWADDAPLSARQQGLVILMEGADPIIEPEQFAEWYERGVRIVGPAWGATRYAGGTGAPGPLTPLGRALLDVMSDYNALLDISHLAEKAALQALDQYTGPIIASHSNPRRFSDSDRHLTDEMILRLAERDGVMGVVIYNRFLSSTWTPGDKRLPKTIVLDVIDAICQLTGSARHVGIGTDFDGGFGEKEAPEGFDTVMDLWSLSSDLIQRGYQPDDVDAILYVNMLRQLKQCLP